MSETIYDVIILGAGVAGLTAAAELRAKKLNVKVLEARDRVGGRIHTAFTPQQIPVELGPEFIHGTENPVWDVVNASPELRVYDVSDKRWKYSQGKLRLDEGFWDEVGEVLAKLKARKPDRSFREFLESAKIKSKTAVELAVNYVEGFHASEISKISEAYLAQVEGSGGEESAKKVFRFSHGYVSFLDVLLKKLELDTVRLNCEAIEVRWQAGKVEVICQDGGSYRAKKILVTLPISLLKQAQCLRFEPEIPRHRAALEKLEMGHVMRMGLLFRERFWEEQKEFTDLAFMHGPKLPFPVWWTYHPMRDPLLIAWAGGPAAKKLELLSLEERIQAALKSLGTLLGKSVGKIRQQLVQVYTHDWAQDPFSRGSYSYVGVGGLETQKLFLRGIDHTVYFAGEAFNPNGESGTVHGAILSARAVVKTLLKAMKEK